MSFSNEIKEELTKIKLRREEEQLSLLAGLTQACGTLRIGRTPAVLYQSECPPVIRAAAFYATMLYDLDATLGTRAQEHRKRPLSVVTLSGPNAKRLLTETGVMSETEDGISFDKHIPEALTETEERRGCFLRGLFMGAGTASDPSRGYHLELNLRDNRFSGEVVELLAECTIEAHVTNRKDQAVVYLKSDAVSSFLALIGASSAALRFEDVRTTKDFRNYINRKSNCETANIDKTVSAGLLQLRAIEAIEEHTDLKKLPAPLFEAAILRLEHPDATLQELADLADIGKSGMNHRLQRLIALAAEYGE